MHHRRTAPAGDAVAWLHQFKRLRVRSEVRADLHRGMLELACSIICLSRLRMLFHGHPGRITSAAVQHILVDWIGLEDEPASFAVGFCPETVDGGWAGPVVPGLAEISEGEYILRKQRIEQGERPVS